jgi:UDP-2-acetamido-3-amino-2,3-dideoxy-glucuronate N-acetyltransferase
MMIHPLADVKSTKIGSNTQIWQFAVVLEDAVIGNDCNINCHTFIENDVQIGNRVTVKSGVYLWDGLVVADDVFIGPNVSFVNDKYPRSKQYPVAFDKTFLDHHASIGCGAIILGGLKIGAYSMVAAGSVVTKNVPTRALVMGNPAKIVAWLNEDGSKMLREDECWRAKDGSLWIVYNNELLKK